MFSVVLANLSVQYFGPASTPFNAFILIGLDLSLRDKIHEKWHGNNLGLKMLLLIMVSALITYLLNHGASRIALASVLAFSGALTIDVLIYQKLFYRSKIVKMNGSNVGSALIDSILFPTIAFGVFMPWIILFQFLAKVFGGAIWTWILLKLEIKRVYIFGKY